MLLSPVIWELVGGTERSADRELSRTLDDWEDCRSQNLRLMRLEGAFCCVKSKWQPSWSSCI